MAKPNVNQRIALDNRAYVKAAREGMPVHSTDYLTQAILRRRTNPKIKKVESTEDAIARGVPVETLKTRKFASSKNSTGWSKQQFWIGGLKL